MIGVATLPLWGYGAYQDIDTRSADNWLWVAILLLGLPGLVTQSVGLLQLGYSILFGVAFAIVLYIQGYIGGADAKAFMVIGIVFFRVSLLIYALTAIGMAIYTLVRDEKSIPVLVPTFVAIVVTLGYIWLF